MKTVHERLQFLIDFINKELGSLRKGDWLNLKEDFRAFLYPDGVSPDVYGGLLVMPSEPPEQCDDKVFLALQDDIGTMLKGVVAKEPRKTDGAEGVHTISLRGLAGRFVTPAYSQFGPC